jgi:hypothetical protein
MRLDAWRFRSPTNANRVQSVRERREGNTSLMRMQVSASGTSGSQRGPSQRIDSHPHAESAYRRRRDTGSLSELLGQSGTCTRRVSRERAARENSSWRLSSSRLVVSQTAIREAVAKHQQKIQHEYAMSATGECASLFPVVTRPSHCVKSSAKDLSATRAIRWWNRQAPRRFVSSRTQLFAPAIIGNHGCRTGGVQ